MPFQRLNTEMTSLLSSIFQRRYEPQFAWKSACSQFQALAGLRGFWPCSGCDENGDMDDMGGRQHHLTNNGDPRFGTNNLAPYVNLDGTGDYFSFVDPGAGSWLDIIGTEGYIIFAERGLTLGGWYQFENAAGAAEYMMSKWDAAGNERSYRLIRNIGGTISFGVSNDGTAITNATTVGTPAAGEWFFAAVRFNNNDNEIKVWYNTESVTAAYANTIHSGTADFNLGARHNGNDLMTGLLSYQFLCAAALPDSVVNQLFQQTRAMFGV